MTQSLKKDTVSKRKTEKEKERQTKKTKNTVSKKKTEED